MYSFSCHESFGLETRQHQVLYYVNKINRSYSIVFIAYTKNEREKM